VLQKVFCEEFRPYVTKWEKAEPNVRFQDNCYAFLRLHSTFDSGVGGDRVLCQGLTGSFGVRVGA